MATGVARMATFADLPTELICEILGYVLPRDIENFAGTCRKTASAAQPFLGVHRNLIRKYAISKIDAIIGGSIGQLAEEVAVDRIGHYVITFECSGFRSPHPFHCDDGHTLTDLLHLLPNLRIFTLDWPRKLLIQLEREITDTPYKDAPSRTRREAVHLKCNGLSDYYCVQVDLVETFCALPLVKRVSLTDMWTSPRMYSLVNPSISNVLTLDLWNCMINLNDLRGFLQGFTQLQSFSYTIPVLPWPTFGLIDSTLITKGLLNSKLTLRKLVVVAPLHRLSKLGSLTDFQALEELQTHVELLPSLHLGESGVPSFQLPDPLQVLKLHSDTYAATKYEYLIEVAIACKSSTNCQLREMMLAFLGNLEIKSKPRLTVDTRKDDELRARCKSVGISLSLFYDGWPTGS